MEYIELNISVADPEQSEIVVALLSDYPFEAFDEAEGELRAYIQTAEWSQCQKWVESMLVEQGLRFAALEVEQQNWNAEWESGFSPVRVDGRRPIYIRAEHHSAPDDDILDVVIAPRMSFGTGHHITTALMSRSIAELDFSGKRGLDMGCGTGVLAIVALKCGAQSMVGVDIDDWACDSCRDSMVLSGVEIDVRCGSMDVVAGEKFDFVLANINRNILLADMDRYASCMHKGSELFMSGFYVQDIPAIREKAESLGMTFLHHREKNNWAAVKFVMK